MFLLPPTLSYCEPIRNAFDLFVLSGDKLFIESCYLELVKAYVTRSVLSYPMIPMTAVLRGSTPIDKLQTLLIM